MSPRKKAPDHEYSGKFLLRISPALHKALDRIAQQEGVSLNSLVGRFLQERVLTGQDSTVEALQYVRSAVSQLLPLLEKEVSEHNRAARAKGRK